MNIYDQIDEGSRTQLEPGVYTATLTKVNAKTSKKGDPMVVLGLSWHGHYLSKYLVIRPDLARIWTGELAKIGLGVTEILADAREQDLSLDQLCWAFVEKIADTRLGAQVEVAVSFQKDSDLPDVKLRRLIAEPAAGSEDGWGEPSDGRPDDDIPF